MSIGVEDSSGLRICVLTGTYPPARCGVGDYAELLSTALAARGARVSVVTSAYLGTPVRAGNPAVLPVVNNWSLTRAMGVLRHILRCQPDIVHFQFPSTEYFAHKLFDLLVPMIKLWPRRIRVVVTFHESVRVRNCLMPRLFRPLRYWLSAAWADAIVVVAESYCDSFYEVSARMKRIPCKVIPIASNIPVSQMSIEQLREVRQRAGIAEGNVVLSYFGFVQPRKGFELVLDVLKVLRSRGVPAELVAIGELSSADTYHKRLLARIARDQLGEYVKVSGYLDRGTVANYLAMSDACILPFVDGLHPKRGSFLAAVAQGVLTITTSNERNGLSADENVYYAKPGDVEEMATAVQQYVARRVAAGPLPWRSWNQIAKEHLDLFLQLLGPVKARVHYNLSETTHEIDV